MAGQSQGYVDAVVVAYIILPMGRIMGQKHFGQTVGQRRICGTEVAVGSERRISDVFDSYDNERVAAAVDGDTLVVEQAPAHHAVECDESGEIVGFGCVGRPVGVVSVVVVAENRDDAIGRFKSRQWTDKRFKFRGVTVDNVACEDNQIRMQGVDLVDKIMHKDGITAECAYMQV